ncbi:MAG: SDR family oxidoreductase [Mesorhizobium sp.]|nr:MAG: SDR family oxidoreductase [Mesorhizobium sp.]
MVESETHWLIGARTTWTDLVRHQLPGAFDALKAAARDVGSVQIQNVASIAGFGWRANLNRAASMIGIEGFPDVARVVADHAVKNEEGYPVSKELLLLWTFRAAHQERFKSRGIRVNAVSPGITDTEIHASGGQPDRVARMQDMLPMKRAGTADEVASAVLYLLSDAASYITGAILNVSGGR